MRPAPRKPAKIRLTVDDYRILAKMEWTPASLPRLSADEQRRFERMYKMHLIDGAPGWFYVRWGWLSIGQFRRHMHYRLYPHAK